MHHVELVSLHADLDERAVVLGAVESGEVERVVPAAQPPPRAWQTGARTPVRIREVVQVVLHRCHEFPPDPGVGRERWDSRREFLVCAKPLFCRLFWKVGKGPECPPGIITADRIGG